MWHLALPLGTVQILYSWRGVHTWSGLLPSSFLDSYVDVHDGSWWVIHMCSCCIKSKRRILVNLCTLQLCTIRFQVHLSISQGDEFGPTVSTGKETNPDLWMRKVLRFKFHSPILETSINSNIRWIPNNFLLHVYDFFQYLTKNGDHAMKDWDFPGLKKHTMETSSSVLKRLRTDFLLDGILTLGWTSWPTFVKDEEDMQILWAIVKSSFSLKKTNIWPFEVRGANSEKYRKMIVLWLMFSNFVPS